MRISGYSMSQTTSYFRRLSGMVPRSPVVNIRAATKGPMGPAPAKHTPDWLRILQEDAAVDEEIAELLKDTGGDPDRVRAKMEQKLQSPYGSSSDGGGGSTQAPLIEARTGSDTPPHVMFKEVDPFDLWVWLEFLVPPSQRERDLLQSTLKSWFVVGKLGGFNSQNLQVYYSNSDDNSFLHYDVHEAGNAQSAYMHSCSDAEFKGSWSRFHVDLGTSDELALDVLLNMLLGFSQEVSGMSRIMVGGEHERWEIPPKVEEEDEFDWGAFDNSGRPKREHGEAPKVGINPMKLPQGVEEDLALMEELRGMQQADGLLQQQQQQTQPHTSVLQQQQQQQRRQWGKGLLKPKAGSNAATQLGLARGQAQQQQQQQVNGNTSRTPQVTAGSRKQQASNQPQQQQMQQDRETSQVAQPGSLDGMTMYTEEEFKKAFGVVDDD